MEQSTSEIISKIADIQLEALNKLKTEKIQEFTEDELCKLLQVRPEYIEQAINSHIQLYEDVKQSPDLVKLLPEYQTSLCSYILWRMESEWININQEGVVGAWAIITEAQRKFHPEYRIIL